MQRWTDAQFDSMTWHDNHVHTLRIIEGEHGAGTLVLDIDYILEWLRGESGAIRFRIARADLKFFGVTSLRFAVDFAAASAALGPFSIDGVERRTEPRERYTATIWTLRLNWPIGEISFEATGFEQLLVGEPIVTDRQWLTQQERTAPDSHSPS
jgi:hypothetical protein